MISPISRLLSLFNDSILAYTNNISSSDFDYNSNNSNDNNNSNTENNTNNMINNQPLSTYSKKSKTHEIGSKDTFNKWIEVHSYASTTPITIPIIEIIRRSQPIQTWGISKYEKYHCIALT
ncbi:hypothetical protein ACTFIU_007101 [Dictyostelium citrinum]